MMWLEKSERGVILIFEITDTERIIRGTGVGKVW